MYRFYTVTSKQFREDMKGMFPQVFSDTDYTKFFYFLVFGKKHRDIAELLDGVTPFLSHDMLCDILGKNPKSFRSGKFLEDFEAASGIALNVTDYVITQSKARTYSPEIPDKVTKLIKAEIATPLDSKTNPVFFLTGNTYTSRKASEMRKSDKEHHYSSYNDTKLNSPIVRYFKELNPVTYNDYQHNVNGLIKDLADNPNLSEAEKTHYLTALQELSVSMMPMYRQDDTTNRVFAAGFSLQNIKREYRREILKGTLEADLKSCHIVIAAYKWQVKSLIKLLETGVSVWEYILEAMQVEYTEAHKQVIKDAMYCVLYGGGKELLYTTLSKAFTTQQSDTFYQLEIVKDLWNHRDVEMKRISNDKQITTIDGQVIKLTGSPAKLLSREAQDIEVYVINAAYEVAVKYPKNLRIVSHEHDGISFEILDESKRDRTIKLLKEAIEDKGQSIGIPLTLELK